METSASEMTNDHAGAGRRVVFQVSTSLLVLISDSGPDKKKMQD